MVQRFLPAQAWLLSFYAYPFSSPSSPSPFSLVCWLVAVTGPPAAHELL